MDEEIGKENASAENNLSMSDYYYILKNNRSYRLAYTAYCIDNVGNWLTFIACMSIVNKLDRTIYTSIYIILRILPALVFAGNL